MTTPEKIKRVRENLTEYLAEPSGCTIPCYNTYLSITGADVVISTLQKNFLADGTYNDHNSFDIEAQAKFEENRDEEITDEEIAEEEIIETDNRFFLFNILASSYSCVPFETEENIESAAKKYATKLNKLLDTARTYEKSLPVITPSAVGFFHFLTELHNFLDHNGILKARTYSDATNYLEFLAQGCRNQIATWEKKRDSFDEVEKLANDNLVITLHSCLVDLKKLDKESCIKPLKELCENDAVDKNWAMLEPHLAIWTSGPKESNRGKYHESYNVIRKFVIKHGVLTAENLEDAHSFCQHFIDDNTERLNKTTEILGQLELAARELGIQTRQRGLY